MKDPMEDRMEDPMPDSSSIPIELDPADDEYNSFDDMPAASVPIELDIPARAPPTPVPALLEESELEVRREVVRHGTGEVPLVDVGAGEELPPKFPDSPVWALPAGFASAWDPRTRDQRPSEVLRPPRPAWQLPALAILVLVAIAAGLHFGGVL